MRCGPLLESSSHIITASGTIRASAMCSFSVISLWRTVTDRFDAAAASAECSIIMIVPPDDQGHSSYWTLRDLIFYIA
jgi:hypothetical protein